MQSIIYVRRPPEVNLKIFGRDGFEVALNVQQTAARDVLLHEFRKDSDHPHLPTKCKI